MYNGLVGLIKIGVDSASDKISKTRKWQTKEKCLGHIICEENIFLSSVPTRIGSIQGKIKKKWSK